MSRPTIYGDRVAFNIRMDVDLRERLMAAAADREVSANLLATSAIIEFLDRLIPADEVKWTR